MCKLAGYGVPIMSHGEERLSIVLCVKNKWRLQMRRIERECEKQNYSFLHWKWKALFYNCLLHRVQFTSQWKRCTCHKHHILQQIKLEESRLLGKEKAVTYTFIWCWTFSSLIICIINALLMHFHVWLVSICLLYLTVWASIFYFSNSYISQSAYKN